MEERGLRRVREDKEGPRDWRRWGRGGRRGGAGVGGVRIEGSFDRKVYTLRNNQIFKTLN